MRDNRQNPAKNGRPNGGTARTRQSSPGAAKKPEQSKKRKMSAADRRGAETVLVIAVLSLVLYVILALLIAFFVWYSFSTPATGNTLYSLIAVDAETEKSLFSYSAGRANNSYGLYLSYKDLANYCDFGVAGDDNQITLFFSEKDSIVCYRNSSLLYVNGNTVRISAPVLFEDDDYLLPINLFESYLTGVTVTYDDAKKVCRVVIPENPVFRLTMDRPEPMEKCNDYDLRMAAGEDLSESPPAA